MKDAVPLLEMIVGGAIRSFFLYSFISITLPDDVTFCSVEVGDLGTKLVDPVTRVLWLECDVNTPVFLRLNEKTLNHSSRASLFRPTKKRNRTKP